MSSRVRRRVHAWERRAPASRRGRRGRRARPGRRPAGRLVTDRADWTGPRRERRRPAVRQLGTPAAAALADLAATFEELQTVLGCCERLVASPPPDELVAEALWTTALLSYARCFAPGPRGIGLTVEDVKATKLEGALEDWHGLLLRMRDHYADPAVDPRERFSVGVSRNADGTPAGIAVTVGAAAAAGRGHGPADRRAGVRAAAPGRRADRRPAAAGLRRGGRDEPGRARQPARGRGRASEPRPSALDGGRSGSSAGRVGSAARGARRKTKTAAATQHGGAGEHGEVASVLTGLGTAEAAEAGEEVGSLPLIGIGKLPAQPVEVKIKIKATIVQLHR